MKTWYKSTEHKWVGYLTDTGWFTYITWEGNMIREFNIADANNKHMQEHIDSKSIVKITEQELKRIKLETL